MMKVPEKYLPSRKFVVSLSIVFALLIIISVIKYVGSEKKETLSVSNDRELNIQNIKIFKAVDTDKDGLTDWEEVLWKTDPKNPDTDGDKTPDGEEITLGRNPLIPNTAGPGKEPNDKVDPEVIASNAKDEEEWNNLNETQKFSRLLFSDYIAVQPADGTTLTTDQTNQLIANSIANIPDKQLEQKYITKDIKTIDNPTSEDILSYSLKIDAVLNNDIKNYAFKEVSIVNEYLTKNDPKILQGIDKIIVFYQKTAEGIINTETPQEVVDSQLLLANSIYNFSSLAKDLRAMDENPLMTIVSMGKYGQVMKNFTQAVDNINLYLSNNI
jgi:hypothetical protein